MKRIIRDLRLINYSDRILLGFNAFVITLKLIAKGAICLGFIVTTAILPPYLQLLVMGSGILFVLSKVTPNPTSVQLARQRIKGRK